MSSSTIGYAPAAVQAHCKALAEAGAKLDGEGLVSEAVVVPTPTAQARKTRALSFTVPEVQPAGAVVAVAPAPATIFSSAESMLTSELHPKKARLPIRVRDDGMPTLTSERQP